MLGSIRTSTIMRDVIIALLPGLAVGAWLFGARVLLVAGVTVAACVVSEFATRRVMARAQTVGDLSAAVTGLLLAMNLPPSIELWKAVVGGAFAIIAVKQIFGGIGQNFMNPALAARIVLLTSWGKSMMQWTQPVRYLFASPAAADAVSAASVDAVSAATPMALAKSLFAAGSSAQAGLGQALPGYFDMFVGNVAGCIGETSAAVLIIGGIYLLARKVITWHVPTTFIATVALLTWAFGGTQGLFTGDPLYNVLGGGLMLGAIFMATDYSTSPITSKGKIIMGIGCGALTAVIRLFAGYPEGVSFAIVIMNVAVPLIDRYSATKVFGASKAPKTLVA
jgi:electron transport complex protein RnfD